MVLMFCRLLYLVQMEERCASKKLLASRIGVSCFIQNIPKTTIRKKNIRKTAVIIPFHWHSILTPRVFLLMPSIDARNTFQQLLTKNALVFVSFISFALTSSHALKIKSTKRNSTSPITDYDQVNFCFQKHSITFTHQNIYPQ